MTTNISVAVKQREDFNLIKQRLEQLKVVDAATVEVAVESIVIAKRLYEFVENHRKSLTDPLKKQIDAINAEHKPILVWLEQARAQIELALKRYRLEEEEKARAEEEKRSPEALPVVPGVEFFIDEIISAH